jgi:hypothetical protein
MPRLRCCFQPVDVGDLQGRPDEGYGLRTHAGKAQEFEHGGLVFCEQLFAEGHGAGVDELHDIGGHGLADSGDGEKLFRFGDKGGELRGLLLNSFGGAAIGADAEGVGCVYLKQGRGFIEQASDGDVVHEEWRAGLSLAESSSPGCSVSMQRREMEMHVDTEGPGEDFARRTGLDGFFEAAHLIGLRTFAAFDDVEFHFVAFLEALVALALDGTVVNEDVCPVIAAKESIAFCVVEPLYGAFILTHLNELPLSS